VTIETVAKKEPDTTPASAVVDQKVVAELVARASAEGVSLTGEGGLLAQLTKLVLESSLEGELDAHLGYSKHDPASRSGSAGHGTPQPQWRLLGQPCQRPDHTTDRDRTREACHPNGLPAATRR